MSGRGTDLRTTRTLPPGPTEPVNGKVEVSSLSTAESPSAGNQPDAGKPPRGRKRGVVVGVAITLISVVLLSFTAFAFSGSNVIASRGQKELLESFKRKLAKVQRTASAPAPAGSSPVSAGEPMAVMKIPAIGLETIVVEGTRPRDLENGPGHLRGTPDPGWAGNVVIAGRRSTFGAPFEQLNQLKPKDRIEIRTRRGVQLYRVTGKKLVQTGDRDVIGRKNGNFLTLVTSHPRFYANERLAVTAKFKGKAVPKLAEAGPLVVADSETGLTGDASALGSVVIWTQILALVLVGAFLATRTIPRRAIYLMASPIALAVLLNLYVGISRLMPATL